MTQYQQSTTRKELCKWLELPRSILLQSSEWQARSKGQSGNDEAGWLFGA
jgi:hypothetical protein